MGCCLPKSFGSKKDAEHNFILLQNNKTSLLEELPSDFDINRGLVMFGQDKSQKNFMLTFNFLNKTFNPVRLQKKGKFN